MTPEQFTTVTLLTHQFVGSVPDGYPAPDMSFGDGDCVEVEWYSSPRRVLSVSIDPDGKHCWAALIGLDSKCGTFTGAMPDDVLDCLKRVYELEAVK